MAGKSYPKFRLVYVEWEDHSGADGWMPLSVARATSSYFCATIGWLLKEDSKRITLAASITLQSDDRPEVDVAGHMTIHRALIKSIRTVKL